MKLPDHKTKIICTIGPASSSRKVMEEMLMAGMNVARLNFSHGSFESHRQVIGDLRKILRLARHKSLHAPGRMQQSLAEHLAVFAALKARDCDAAEEAMRTHLLRQRDALRDVARNQQSRLTP